jgi:coniferyl-aldehyde dehydrogenase
MTDTPEIAFGRLRAAFSLAAVPDTRARIARLRDLSRAIHSAPLAAAISADFGHRAEVETATADIGSTLDAIAHLIRILPAWTRQRSRWVMKPLPGRAAVWREPKGVVGILSPWNYPVQLALVPLATAIAAGNRVLLKPSERSPRTTEALARMLADVFPPDEVATVDGGPDVAAAVANLPVDHLFFTGSTATGRKVALAAATNLTPVTLELGGKSPCILMPDADPRTHAALVGWGKWFSAGQTCVAPDYLLVPRGTADAWGDAMLQVAEGFLADNGRDYTALIDTAHRDRLTAMLAEGGTARQIPTDLPGRMAPTIVTNPPLGGALMTEEIFGPILPIVEYDTPAEAAAHVNAGDPPLAAYAFGRDVAAATALMRTIRSGGAAINGTILHLAEASLPFGGIGTSGMGAYHGKRGLAEFSHERGVLTVAQHRWTRLLLPPYPAFLRRSLLRKMRRR